MSDRSQKLLLDVLGYLGAVAVAVLTIFAFRRPIDHARTILIGRL